MFVKVLWLLINIRTIGSAASFLPAESASSRVDVRPTVFANASTLICHRLKQRGSCHF